ncbi:MAG: polysaccharide deacetylase family protein [Pseudoramibacter sp.]
MKRKEGESKLKGTGMIVLIGVVIAAFVLIGISIYHAVQIYRVSQYTDVKVDGTVKAVSGKTSNRLMKAYQKSAPADIVTGDKNAGSKSVCIVFSGLSNDETMNEKVLKIVKARNIKAAFAVPAIQARGNSGFIKKIKKSGCTVISGGLNGEEQNTKTLKTLCSHLYKSRQILNEESGSSIQTLYAPGLKGDASTLKAAAAGGYKQMVLPEDDDIIKSSTFADSSEAAAYVQSLTGARIVLISLDSKADPVNQEPAVESATPAIDKQEDLDDDKAKAEKETTIDQATKWLLDALNAQQVGIQPLDQLKAQHASDYLGASLKDDSDQAVVYRSALINEKKIGLCVRSVGSRAQYDRLKKLLERYKAGCAFFVTDATNQNLKKQIRANGYALENAGQTGRASGDVQKMFQEIDGGAQSLQKLGANPGAYLVYEPKYTPQIRAACFAAGQIPVQPENPKTISKGAFYLYDAQDLSDIEKLLKKARREGYQVDSVSRLIDASGTIPELTREDLNARRRENAGKKAKYTRTVQTTDKALALTFGNLNNTAVDLDVANRLKKRGAKGTFFATFNEMQSDSDTIEKLIAMGNEIGVNYNANTGYGHDYDGMARYLHDCQTYMKWRYNKVPKVVMLSEEDARNKGVLEAVHAYHMKAVGASRSLITSGTENTTSADLPQVFDRLKTLRFTRGGLEYINLGYYQNDKDKQDGDQTVMGDMVDGVIDRYVDTIAFVSPTTNKIEDSSRYRIKTVSGLFASKKVYQLSAKKQNVVTRQKDVLSRMDSSKKQFAYMKNHYVGSNFVVNAKKLPGFTDNEIKQLDKVGRLTDDKVLFLTFDDWGTDQSINKILYVLKKHHVKATFFVLTQHVDENPNLLRAIAMDGHEIASHSNTHVPLSDANADYTQYTSLTGKEQKAMRKDLVTSYNKLNHYVGDVKVGGKKALSRDFRPPTLEVSKAGLYQVFDVGFQYAVSGDVSTNDYKRTDLNAYLNAMRNGSPSDEDDFKVKNGSVIVMHMTENAKYTAQMLDEMIPQWQQEGYHFARVDDYVSQFKPRGKRERN